MYWQALRMAWTGMMVAAKSPGALAQILTRFSEMESGQIFNE